MIQPKLYFLHIPKTAGTTFRWMLYNRLENKEMHIYNPKKAIECKNRAKNIKQNQFLNIRVIAGPISFGYHKLFPIHDFRYFTFLRNPIDRFVSEYYYIFKLKDHKYYEMFHKENKTLDDFIDICSETNYYNNQVRMIAGNIDDDDETNLKIALGNIDKHFPVVGITESFNKSLYLFSLIYSISWKKLRYVTKNVNKRKKSSNTIDDSTLNRIRELNKYDIELYDYCKKRLEKQILNLGKIQIPKFEISSRIEKSICYVKGRTKLLLRDMRK